MINLTCNPSRPEMTANLLSGEIASHNPWLITTRVIRHKLAL